MGFTYMECKGTPVFKNKGKRKNANIVTEEDTKKYIIMS